jgi:hypothetical protein
VACILTFIDKNSAQTAGTFFLLIVFHDLLGERVEDSTAWNTNEYCNKVAEILL